MRTMTENRWEQVSVARGMAIYDAHEDDTVDDTVRRADKLMYENKWEQKGRIVKE
jgi:GGDEF domain-containing protein